MTDDYLYVLEQVYQRKRQKTKSEILYWVHYTKPKRQGRKLFSMGKKNSTLDIVNYFIVSRAHIRSIIKTVVKMLEKNNLYNFLSQDIETIKTILETLKTDNFWDDPEINSIESLVETDD